MFKPLLFDDMPDQPPLENKFHIGVEGKHNWLTDWTDPEIVKLVKEFGPFDFDPCPYPKPPGFDGLTCDWGKRNWVNPPFGAVIGSDGKKKGMTAWMNKAIAERRKGNLSVLVFPLDKWVLKAITEIFGHEADIRNIGDQRWLSIEDRTPGPGTGRHIAAFILRPTVSSTAPSSDERQNAVQHAAKLPAEIADDADR